MKKNIAIESTEMKRFIRKYYKQPYSNRQL